MYCPWAAIHLVFVLVKNRLPEAFGSKCPTLFEDMLGSDPAVVSRVKFVSVHAVFSLVTVYIGAVIVAWQRAHERSLLLWEFAMDIFPRLSSMWLNLGVFSVTMPNGRRCKLRGVVTSFALEECVPQFMG